MKEHKRSLWGSKIGFILATAGSAIGLGNIQRFPYLTAKSGGAGFLFVYLICVLLLGFPLILNEFALGRHISRNPVCGIKKIAPKGAWKGIGYLGIMTAFLILSYYSVVGGWTIGYIFESLLLKTPKLENFTQNSLASIGNMAIFLAIVVLIVQKGIKKGIEKYCKILMPLLFILLIILMIRSVTLKGSYEGLVYYLKPDFSKISGSVILLALSQAFFSLSIGEAVLVTYGSYASKKENLFSSAFYVVIFDTLIAFLSGLVIFPALFAFDMPVDQGVGLVFKILPQIFQKMHFGFLFSAIFFTLLAFAAITTGIALLEMPVTYLIDSRKWTRKKAVTVMGCLAFILGIPSALSKGAVSWLSNIKIESLSLVGVYDIMDFFWGSLGMVLGGWLLAIFVGWKWKLKEPAMELKKGSSCFRYYEPLWKFTIRYGAPVMIFIILLNLFNFS